MDQTITSLTEKLEGAEVGSVELDALIYSHLNCTLIPRRADYRPRRRWPNGSVTHQRKVTTSLDAALALAERVLGEGWAYSVIGEIGGGSTVTLEQPDVDMGDGVIASPGLCGLSDFEGEAATPALALCAAILRAQSEVH